MLAGYALARLIFPGSTVMGIAIFVTYLVPPTLLFIPLTGVISWMGLQDTSWSLIFTYPTFLVPFCTWLLMGYFQTIPKELEECARIDGATRIQAMVWIILPLAVPGILSAGIFAFTLSWNEFLYALVFISLAGEQDHPGRGDQRADQGRRVLLGLADGRGAVGLGAGRGRLLLLRRVLRVGDDRRGQRLSRPAAIARRPPSESDPAARLAAPEGAVGRTTVDVEGDRFLIDGRPTYPGRYFRGHRIEGCS